MSRQRSFLQAPDTSRHIFTSPFQPAGNSTRAGTPCTAASTPTSQPLQPVPWHPITHFGTSHHSSQAQMKPTVLADSESLLHSHCCCCHAPHHKLTSYTSTMQRPPLLPTTICCCFLLQVEKLPACCMMPPLHTPVSITRAVARGGTAQQPVLGGKEANAAHTPPAADSAAARQEQQQSCATFVAA